MIIVEGIDRVGKTTLVNKIHEELHYPVLKDPCLINAFSSRGNMHVNTEKMKSVLNCISQLVTEEFVIDRFHWSEYAYGKVDRGYINMFVPDIEVELQRLGAKIIFVHSTDIIESSKQHGKDLSTHEEIFERLFIQSNLNKIAVDYASLEDAITWLTEQKMKEVLK